MHLTTRRDPHRTRVSKPRGSRRLGAKDGTVMAAAIACIGLGASVGHAATVAENFEAFTLASGSTVNGYADAPNSWSSSSGAVVNSDATAYDGTHYLRLPDQSSSSTFAAEDIFSAPVYAGGATISFALRDDSSFNNDQVVIYAGSQIALQLGLQYNSPTSGKISYTSYSAGTGTGHTLASGAAIVANDWLLFNVTYSVSGTTGTYAVTVTDTTANSTVVPTTSGLGGQAAFSGVANLTNLYVQTSSQYTGNADFDALSISNPVPEPASMCGLALVAGGLMRRTRRGARTV
jgi:hypothetical protein